MSGTELSRLMADVTAQPPVDVDFSAIAGRVRRRRKREGFAAVAATVVAVVAIAVPTALSSGGKPSASRLGPPAPTSLAPPVAAIIDPSWVSGSWGDFGWRQPKNWKVVDTGLGDHSRPPQAPVDGFFLTTEKLGKGCYSTGPNSGACSRDRVLQHLPPDGVVVELVGEFFVLPGGTVPADDPGTLTAPDATCTLWGGASSFTASRVFGPPDGPNVLQMVGCLGASVTTTAAAELRTVMAGATDSKFNAVPTGVGQQMTAGSLRWNLPSTWGRAGSSSERRFAPFCGDGPKAGRSEGCDSSDQIGKIVDGGTFAWVSELKQTSDPSKDAADYSPYGQVAPATAPCKSAGGSGIFVDSRHLGPVSSGEILTLTACVTDLHQDSQLSELRGILSSAADDAYPSAASLCTTVPGIVESSALDTVGDLRVLRWGKAKPAIDAFPHAPASDFAAWCWVRDDASQQFVVYAAHQGDAAVFVVDVRAPTYWGTRPPPSAAPTSLFASKSYYQTTPPPLGNKTATPTASGSTAMDLCKSALGKVASAALTTVSDIRTATWGPLLSGGKGNLAKAFPGAKDSDPAAWCWTGGGSHYLAYAVHAGDTPVEAGDMSTGGDVTPVPSGQPLFP